MSKHFTSAARRINACLAALPLALVAISSSHAQPAEPPQGGLRAYFPAYGVPGRLPPYSSLPPSGFPPEVHVIGGGIDPPPITTGAGTFFSVDRFVKYLTEMQFGVSRKFELIEYLAGTCFQFQSRRSIPQRSNELASGQTGYNSNKNDIECRGDSFLGEQPLWKFTDVHTTVAPTRRKAINGSEYEAAALVIERDGAPWMTYFAGYRLGIVASASNWNDVNRNRSVALSTWPSYPNSRDNFELAKLPPPFVEGELVEYEYRVGLLSDQFGVFAYAVNLDEQTAMDKLATWERTGERIKTGGYLPVCRFDTTTTGGVAGRFFSASDRDCAALLSAPGLAAKGVAFRASLPIASTGSCPAATVAITRLYNNGIARGAPPNHRYVSRGDASEPIATWMTGFGWVNEGVAFCVPD